MSTSKETIDYFLTQTARAGNMRARKMFGEYAPGATKRIRMILEAKK